VQFDAVTLPVKPGCENSDIVRKDNYVVALAHPDQQAAALATRQIREGDQ
jgi:hypothetical protein